MKHTLIAIAVILFSVLAIAGGRWDADYVTLNPSVTVYSADAGAGRTVTLSPTNYYRVTCDKDFKAATGTAQVDGGFFCHDIAPGRCSLFRSTSGEKMYVQLSGSSNRLALQAANATEVIACTIDRANN